MVEHVFRENRQNAPARLGARAEKFIALADEARGPVVQFALRALHGGGKPEGASARDARVARWVGAFEARVDREFFDALWGAAELDDDAAQAAWSSALVRLGRETLEEAMESTALPCARRHLIRGATRNCFEGSARRRLPGAFSKETET
jgi:hypothetical protein